VHFSTDYVFSGRSNRPYREDDAAEPLSVYGQSKLAGEEAVSSRNAEGLVIRSQWLFGTHGRSFPALMRERARSRIPTRVVDDQFGRPTYSADLALWTWELVAKRTRGIVHAANGGIASWFDVAGIVFDRENARECLTPCRTADYPTRARRPAYSVLDISKLETLIGPVPTWENALSRFLTTASS
jgi:dTDP-4-dehydrorhamnose reductase